MKEKFFYIESTKARNMLKELKDIKTTKRGIEHNVYLIDDYAILSSESIKIRNVTTRDDNLAYFDELIVTLMNLWKQGVSVVPILGYCYDEKSKNGSGYIFQMRAKGAELYSDEIMKEYYVWAQSASSKVCLANNADAKEYIISRTNYISKIPQKHFDKFINDIIILIENDILIDFMGKSNFFYDEEIGFQFIDINSHTDYKYGLSKDKFDSRLICAYNGFVPCHIDFNSKVLPQLALDKSAIEVLDDKALQQLSNDNKVIYEKCKSAMLNNGVSEQQLDCAFELLKLFGV